MLREVTTWHLEMTSPDRFRPRECPDPTPGLVAVHPVAPAFPELNRFLYSAIGRDWHWDDRLVWSPDRWREYADRPELQTGLLTVGGIPAGYYELERQAEGSFEIVYFGVVRTYAGRGLGGYLLTEAVRSAWAGGATRVWVHTCDLDQPYALAHYRARGFEVFHTERREKDV